MILTGNVLDTLVHLDTESVQCVVTSPPYFGLRDYGVDGQIGLEDSPEDYIKNLVEVFRQIRRVLRDDGTLWLNIGDSYGGTRGKQGTSGQMSDRQVSSQRLKNGISNASKQLLGVPWKLAFALQQDGWYLRQDIIWSKPNPMPESVKDRCTKSHEYVFLFSKSKKYYFDADSIKEPLAESSIKRLSQNVAKQKGTTQHVGKTNGNFKAQGDLSSKLRNKRSVWEISTRPFKEAHFATFPVELVEPCILAGSPEGGVVLDPFFGAGTTGVACQKHGRRWIGCELNPDYVEIAKKRLSIPTPTFSFKLLLAALL